MKEYYCYLLSNQKNGTLYLGVTSHLIQRVEQHKQGEIEGFSQRYGISKLVWYEIHTDVTEAILREKQIKKWNRAWKIRLIEETNPDWQDLFDDLCKE